MLKRRVFSFGRTVSLTLFLCLVTAIFAPAAFADEAVVPFDLTNAISKFGNIAVMETVSCWDDLVSVSVSSGPSGDFVLGLKSDGSVVAAGDNDNGQCNVEQWQDITRISAGNGISVGLKADGSAICAGFSDYDLSCVEQWEKLKEIDSGASFVLGIDEDGRQHFAGFGEFNIDLWFQADTANKVWEDKDDEIRFWNDLRAVRAGGENILGMDSRGELRYFGFTQVRELPEFEKTIADFDVSRNNGAVLFTDGTAQVWGDNSCGQCPDSQPEGITQVALGAEHSVFLRDDGRVFACGSNDYGQRDVANWENIVFVEAGDTCTLGITQDGRLMIAGVLR